MGRKTKTYNKIAKVLTELGYSLEKKGELFIFNKDSLDYLIFIDEDKEVFSISQYVTVHRSIISQAEFEEALEITIGTYKDYEGEWYKEMSYFSSPLYSLSGLKTVPADQMKKVLDEFFEAYDLMCVNVCDVANRNLEEKKHL